MRTIFNYPHRFSKTNPRKIDVDLILTGLDSEEYRTAAEVASRIGVSSQRASWMLCALGTQVVERKEAAQAGRAGYTRTVWRKKL